MIAWGFDISSALSQYHAMYVPLSTVPHSQAGRHMVVVVLSFISQSTDIDLKGRPRGRGAMIKLHGHKEGDVVNFDWALVVNGRLR